MDSEVWGNTTVLTPSAVQQVRTDTNILTAPPMATPTALPVHKSRGDKPHPHSEPPDDPMTALSARLFTVLHTVNDIPSSIPPRFKADREREWRSYRPLPTFTDRKLRMESIGITKPENEIESSDWAFVLEDIWEFDALYVICSYYRRANG